MIIDHSALLLEVSEFCGFQCDFRASKLDIFEHSLISGCYGGNFEEILPQANSLQIWNSTLTWLKTAHSSLVSYETVNLLNITVPFLPATHDHTQDEPSRIRIHAPTIMQVCIHMYAHWRTHTHVLTRKFARLHIRAYIHARAYAHPRANANVCLCVHN